MVRVSRCAGHHAGRRRRFAAFDDTHIVSGSMNSVKTSTPDSDFFCRMNSHATPVRRRKKAPKEKTQLDSEPQRCLQTLQARSRTWNSSAPSTMA